MEKLANTLKDNVLAKILPKQPTFVYRWPPIIRNKTVKIVPDSLTKIFTGQVRFFKCGRYISFGQFKNKARKTTNLRI